MKHRRTRGFDPDPNGLVVFWLRSSGLLFSCLHRSRCQERVPHYSGNKVVQLLVSSLVSAGQLFAEEFDARKLLRSGLNDPSSVSMESHYGIAYNADVQWSPKRIVAQVPTASTPASLEQTMVARFNLARLS